MTAVARTYTCRACGRPFEAFPTSTRPGKLRAYCSPTCAREKGPWSYAATRPTLQRVYGETR